MLEPINIIFTFRVFKPSQPFLIQLSIIKLASF